VTRTAPDFVVRPAALVVARALTVYA
jgi:hypothetical protein